MTFFSMPQNVKCLEFKMIETKTKKIFDEKILEIFKKKGNDRLCQKKNLISLKKRRKLHLFFLLIIEFDVLVGGFFLFPGIYAVHLSARIL